MEGYTYVNNDLLELKAYRDTGLTPEEIKDFKAWLNEDREELNDLTLFNDIGELARYRKTGLTPEEIKDKEQQWQEGEHEYCGEYGTDNCQFKYKLDQIEKERDYWEREAKKWCMELGKIKEDAANELCG